MGPGPLLWSEIDAFRRVTNTELSPFDLDVIEGLDSAWAKVMNDEAFSPFDDDEGE